MASPDWIRNLGENSGTNTSGEMGEGDHVLLANRAYVPVRVPWTLERSLLDIQIEITVPDQTFPLSSQWWAAMAIGFSVRVNPTASGPATLVFNTPDELAVMTGSLKLQGLPYVDPDKNVTAVWANTVEYQSKGMRKVDPAGGLGSVDVDVELWDPVGLLPPSDGHQYGWVMSAFLRALYAY